MIEWRIDFWGVLYKDTRQQFQCKSIRANNCSIRHWLEIYPMDSVNHILNRGCGKEKIMDVPFIPNINACMKITSFRGVVKNNLTLKTKS